MTVNIYTPSLPMVVSTTYTMPIMLLDYDTPQIVQASPTIAAGDAVLYRKASGTWSRIGNLTTAPALISGSTKVLLLTVLDTEIPAGTQAVGVMISDQTSPAEWCDLLIVKDIEAAMAVGTSDFAGGSVASVTAGVTLADNAITAAKIANGAIGSTEAPLLANLDTTVSSRAAASVFTGITSLSNWLRALLRKSTPDATALSEINTGGGAYDATTDSLEANRDNIGTAGAGLTHVSFSTLAADFWAYAKRTLTMSPAEIESLFKAGAKITVYNNAEINISMTDLGSLANHSEIWFTVKPESSYKTTADAAATIQISHTTGLLCIAGSTSGVTAGNGSITVDDETAGDITIILKAADAAKLEAGNYRYDVKVKRSTGVLVQVLVSGKFQIDSSVTKAVS